MSKGLRIKEQGGIKFGTIMFWFVFVGLATLITWYGYRFYTQGDVPALSFMEASVAQPDVDENDITPDQKDEHNVPSTYPRFLSIPDLSITNSRVFEMGVNENGELDTPPNIFDTGWYGESALPGDGSGAMLMDGHNGGPTKDGVFKHLPGLEEGSDIMIERGDGERFTYRVESVEVMPVKELNNGGMSELANSIDPSTQGLNIISCTGNWVPAMQTYDKRVVVRAALVE